MNKIAEHIVERLNEFNPYYMYAEQERLPYCVYEIASESPIYTKHGIAGWKAEATVYLAESSESKAQQFKEKVLAILGEKRQGYTIVITSMQPAFAEEQWLWKVDFSITQYFN